MTNTGIETLAPTRIHAGGSGFAIRRKREIVRRWIRGKNEGGQNILKFDRLIKVLIKLDERQSTLSLN